MATEQPGAQEALAWETRERVRAGVGSIAAGVLTLAGSIASIAVKHNQPNSYAINAIRDAAGAKPTGGGVATPRVLWFDDHATSLIGSTAAVALGAALVAVALGFLYRATQARSERLPRVTIYFALLGPLLVGISQLANVLALASKASTFAGGSDRSTIAAHDALHGGIVDAAGYLAVVGALMLIAAFILISLNAMRVGLLTRFLGALGIGVGILSLVPGGALLPIVEAFWLISLGLLVTGRWPGGYPPAWVTGEAQPWPSQIEMREARERARIGEVGTPPDIDAAPSGSRGDPRDEPVAQAEVDDEPIDLPQTPGDPRDVDGPDDVDEPQPDEPAADDPRRDPPPGSGKRKRKRKR